jgi:uncharacterized protein
MSPSSTQALLSVLSGTFVGFSLGLVGGGGSILAVPLLVYVVRVGEPHIAIGTSAVAVAGNAAVNLWHHARGGKVVWGCASVFAVAGILGAFFGSTIGKMVDGQKLLAGFAVLMMVIAAIMVWGHAKTKHGDAHLNSQTALRLAVIGLAAGFLSGFFGIGGGFLIVPGLMLATGMSILNAIASSLLAVTAFGATTAANYAISGAVDWLIAALFLVGGAFGGFAGSRLAHALAGRRGVLNLTFAALIFLVAIYMLVRSVSSILQ